MDEEQLAKWAPGTLAAAEFKTVDSLIVGRGFDESGEMRLVVVLNHGDKDREYPVTIPVEGAIHLATKLAEQIHAIMDPTDEKGN